MKVITIIGILIGLLFTPFQYYLYNIEFEFKTLLPLLFISFILEYIMIIQLIHTNDPNTKYNIFSINTNWTNRIIK